VVRTTGEAVAGVVVVGDQRGRELGFPTANLVMPAGIDGVRDGVYAGTFTGGSAVERPAAISIGRRPTFYEDGARLLEAHVVDFNGDLYGELAVVSLVEFLRPQCRFRDRAALVTALERDVARTRARFARDASSAPSSDRTAPNTTD
jgi:FAD synthase